MKIRTLIGKICNSCWFQLLVGIGFFLLLSVGLTGGSHWLAANAPVCYWIVAGVVILLLIPLALLVILSFVALFLPRKINYSGKGKIENGDSKNNLLKFKHGVKNDKFKKTMGTAVKKNTNYTSIGDCEKKFLRISYICICVGMLSIGLWFVFRQQVFIGLFFLLISMATLIFFTLLASRTIKNFKCIHKQKQSWHYSISNLFILFFCIFFSIPSIILGAVGIIVILQVIRNIAF